MEAHAQYGDQVRFIGMPGLAGTSSMERFVAENGIEAFPHVPDPDGTLWERFGVRHQRTYVFVNDDGTVRTGGYGRLVADVEELIAA